MRAGLDIDVPIAAVEHWAYCPRQCALIHVEGGWADNVHTTVGHVAHAVVDTAGVHHQPGRRLHHRVAGPPCVEATYSAEAEGEG